MMKECSATRGRRMKAAAAVLAAVLMLMLLAGCAGQKEQAATPTPDPYALMYSMIGDWRRTDANAMGIVEIHLHGDNTATYLFKDVFDPEPRVVNTRWQAQNDILSLVTEGSEATQFVMRLEGDTMTLTYATGQTETTVTYERYVAEPAATPAG